MAVRTDFVAGEVLAAQDLDDTFAAKIDYATPVNTQTGTTYTFVLADGLRLTTANNAAASTFTVPPQSSVVWLANSIIRLVNLGAGAVTINGGSGVTVTNTAATVAQFQSVDCIRTGSDAWTVVVAGGGGKILQVVFATTQTQTQTTSTSYVNTALTATITPANASNKVFISFTGASTNAAANSGLFLTIFRGNVSGTNLATLGTGLALAHTQTPSTSINTPAAAVFLDSPNTTSAQAYTIALRSDGQTVRFPQTNLAQCSVILMEVSA